MKLKIRILRKGDGKSDDREKGLKVMMRNDDNKNLESKKRCFDDDDFKVEKRRRRIERVLPAPPPTVIHRGGWDYYCQNKPKSHENWEQGCLRNRGGRDCEKKPKNLESCRRGRDCRDTKKTSPLEKEKESCCRSDDSSSRAAIHEGCTTTTTTSLTVVSQISPTRALRAAMMKKRYAHLIFKATHQPLGDLLKQQQERERVEIAEKARIEEEIKAAQTLVRMRAEADLRIQREAARIALEKMEKTVEFNDAWQIMRDFESLLNSTG